MRSGWTRGDSSGYALSGFKFPRVHPDLIHTDKEACKVFIT